MSKTETIIRIPKVGERVEAHTEDRGDAGFHLPTGARGVINKVEFDEQYNDYSITVNIEGFGSEHTDDGGWSILAEYGVNGNDYYDGKSSLEAFWSIFQTLDNKQKHLRWAIIHGSKHFPQWTAPFRQGRYTFETFEECQQGISDMVANTSENTLRQVYSDEGFATWRPALYEVYSDENRDPKSLIFDTANI